MVSQQVVERVRYLVSFTRYLSGVAVHSFYHISASSLSLSLAAFRSSVFVFRVCIPPRFLFLSPSSFYPLSFFFSSFFSILLLPPRFLPLSPSFLYPLLCSLPPSPLSFFQLPIPLPFPNPPFLPHTLFTPRR